MNSIEIHLIQNFPPACLNRDDANNPKDCLFGGVRRARVSSQCLKRSAREWFREHTGVAVGERTKLLKDWLLRTHFSTDDPAQASTIVDSFITIYYGAMENEQKTKVLNFVSPAELQVAADYIRSHWQELLPKQDDGGKKSKEKSEGKVDKALVEQLRQAALSTDIALFGRMLAEHPDRNIEAACQVAHAISTHRVEMELDFYTAVDDRQPEDTAGAGMMGYIGFNSACFYRYALIDLDQLTESLGNPLVARQALEAFLRASVFAIPTGKQTSTAPQAVPSFGLFVARHQGMPISLVNAFARPVHAEDDDLIGASIKALTQHWTTLQRVYGAQGIVNTALFHMGQDDSLGELSAADCGSVDAAIARMMAAVTEGVAV